MFNIKFLIGLTIFLFMSIAPIHASWGCNQTGLNIVVRGKMKDNETEEMEKNDNVHNMLPGKKGWGLL